MQSYYCTALVTLQSPNSNFPPRSCNEAAAKLTADPTSLHCDGDSPRDSVGVDDLTEYEYRVGEQTRALAIGSVGRGGHKRPRGASWNYWNASENLLSKSDTTRSGSRWSSQIGGVAPRIG